jgi:hypothetical protein
MVWALIRATRRLGRRAAPGNQAIFAAIFAEDFAAILAEDFAATLLATLLATLADDLALFFMVCSPQSLVRYSWFV